MLRLLVEGEPLGIAMSREAAALALDVMRDLFPDVACGLEAADDVEPTDIELQHAVNVGLRVLRREAAADAAGGAQ